MKRLLLSALLLSALFANAQITLLHTFEEDGVSAYSPTIVEDLGIYYYTTDSIETLLTTSTITRHIITTIQSSIYIGRVSLKLQGILV